MSPAVLVSAEESTVRARAGTPNDYLWHVWHRSPLIQLLFIVNERYIIHANKQTYIHYITLHCIACIYIYISPNKFSSKTNQYLIGIRYVILPWRSHFAPSSVHLSPPAAWATWVTQSTSGVPGVRKKGRFIGTNGDFPEDSWRLFFHGS